MVTPEIVRAISAHADAMAPLLRPFDREEIAIMFGPDPAEMLRHGIERSSHAYAAIEGGVPFAIGGVVPLSMMGGEGMPWMLGTQGVVRNRRWFLRESRRQLARVFDTYDHLHNVCDARYEKSVRWLRWLGFTIGDPVPVGDRGLPYLPFSMRRP